MTFSVHQIPDGIVMVLSLWIAAVVWRRRPAPGATMFVAAVLAVGVWAATNALEWGSPSPEARLGWLRLQFIAIAALPVFWLLFAMRFSGRRGWGKRYRSWLLWVIPAITVVLVWTHEYHDWMVGPLEYDDSIPFTGVRYTYGPWFWVLALYSYALLGYGTLAILTNLARAPGLYRWQVAAICCAAAVPIAANATYIMGFSLVPGLDLTPPAFMFSSIVIGWSLLRWRFLDLVPAARAVVVECMADGMIVVDAQGRVVDLNPAAQTITSRSVRDALGQPLTKLFPSAAGWLARLDGSEATTAELALFAADRPGHYYEVRAMLLHDTRGQETGRLVLLRDVSERRRADAERAQLVEKLQEAVSNIKTLSGLIPICAACKRVRDDQGYWQQVEEYVSAHSQVEFSHGLCPECMARLYEDADSHDARGTAAPSPGRAEHGDASADTERV